MVRRIIPLNEEMARLRNLNRRLRLERDFDDLQKQIDLTLGEITSSTPSTEKSLWRNKNLGSTKRGLTLSQHIISKPRRLLPSIPIKCDKSFEDDKDRFVTLRRRKNLESHPFKTRDKSDDSPQFTAVEAKPKSKSMGTTVKPEMFDGSTGPTQKHILMRVRHLKIRLINRNARRRESLVIS